MKPLKTERPFLIFTLIGLILIVGAQTIFCAVCANPSPDYTAEEIAAMVIEPINLNTASAEELSELSSISAPAAERIVRYRYEHGHFNSLDELKEIKGITPRIIEQIRMYVTLE